MTQHNLAQSLQRSLLPTELPVAPMVRMAARYVAAGDDAGGDWFDAVLLPDGTVAAAVGDVASQGVTAATAMVQLRSALTAYALLCADAVDLLHQLDGYARYLPAAVGATVCVALLDPATGELHYASAGHPPPLLVGSDGQTRYLQPAPGRPLGLSEDRRIRRSDRLGPGEVLVMHSDGALARRGQPIEQGRARLAMAAGAAVSGGADAEAVCAGVLAELAGDLPAQDDIALLVLYRLAEPVPPLRMTVPARPGQLAVLRHQLDDWMNASGIGEDDAVSVQIAVGEAAGNAIEHAYPDRAPDEPGDIHLTVTVTPDGELHAEVSDRGRWRDPGPADRRRGRGLPLIRACMDSMELSHRTGTSVRLRRRLRRPIGPPTAAGPAVPAAPEAIGADLDMVPGAERVLLRLRGDLDLAATDAISGRVWAATRGGTVAATVDLTRVSYLASPAVRLLFELAADGTRHDRPMIVWVTAGSAVEQVIRLTGLDQAADVYHRPAGSPARPAEPS